MSHSLSTTDVTRAQIPNRPEMPAYPSHSPMEDKKMYYAVNQNMILEKCVEISRKKHFFFRNWPAKYIQKEKHNSPNEV